MLSFVLMAIAAAARSQPCHFLSLLRREQVAIDYYFCKGEPRRPSSHRDRVCGWDEAEASPAQPVPRPPALPNTLDFEEYGERR